jgi:hypothetical protein
MFLEPGAVLRQELFSLLNALEIQERLIEKRIMKRIFFASLAQTFRHVFGPGYPGPSGH